MKKFILKILILVFFVVPLSAVDISFKISPSYTFAVPDKENSGTKNIYDAGFAGFLQTDINLFNLLSLGVEAGFVPQTITGYDFPFNCYNFGLGLGVYYYPLSRLYVGAGGAFGCYVGQLTLVDENNVQTSSNKMDFYWRAYGEAGFRFNPNITLNAFGGVISYMAHNGSESSGNITNRFYAGGSLRVDVATGKKSTSAFSVNFEQPGPVIPAYSPLYRTNAFGSVKIRNGETAEIRNVKISFNGGKYTSSTLICSELSQLRRGAVVEVPLLADFSNEILNFSEDGKFSGEVVIEYSLLGKKKQFVQTVVVSVANRNSFYWDDPDSLCAFVSSDNTNEVLQLAKSIAGVARDNLYTGMNRNLQFAAAMLEGLRLSGITYSEDKITPFKEYHLTSERDFIQFPLETMNCLSGDIDDIGILYASCLEAIGVKTAFIYTADDFLVLVSLGILPEQAENHFADTNEVICIDDEVYLVLSMSEYENGFTACRKAGAVSDVSDGVLINIDEAWQNYPSVAYTGKGSSFENPSKADLLTAISDAIKDYIDDELIPLINQLKISGDLNKLGVAYVRAGKYDDALVQFQKAAAKGSVAAMNNMANVYTTLKNYEAAAAQYKKVLAINSENKSALRGYETVSLKLEE